MAACVERTGGKPVSVGKFPQRRPALTVRGPGAIRLRPFAERKSFFFLESPMANTRSAEKQNRQAQKHRIRNAHVLSTLLTTVRKLREAAAAGDPDKTRQELASAVRQIAKAASKGVIHKAQASRRISRLTKAASQVP